MKAPPTKLLVLAFWSAIAVVLVAALIPQPPHVPGGDKAHHMIAFAVLTSLASHAYYRASLVTIGLGLAAFGGLIEVLQAIPGLGRHASAMDWAADCLGVAVVLAVTHLNSRR